MWNNTGSFSEGGYDQGGGFMKSPGLGQPGFSSQGSTNKASGGKRNQAMVQCTAAQVLSAVSENDLFLLDGVHEVSQVELLGVVRSVAQQSVRMDYHIEDYSGPLINVRHFMDMDEDQGERRKPVMREGALVRVIGHIRAYQDQRYINAFKVEPVTDMNKLTFHLTRVFHGTLSRAKRQETFTRSAGAPMSSGLMGSVSMDRSWDNKPQQSTGGQSMEDKILDVIRRSTNEEGISVVEVKQQLPGVTEKAIRETVDFLSGEGHIYTTVDDDHFCSTDAAM